MKDMEVFDVDISEIRDRSKGIYHNKNLCNFVCNEVDLVDFDWDNVYNHYNVLILNKGILDDVDVGLFDGNNGMVKNILNTLLHSHGMYFNLYNNVSYYSLNNF